MRGSPSAIKCAHASAELGRDKPCAAGSPKRARGEECRWDNISLNDTSEHSEVQMLAARSATTSKELAAASVDKLLKMREHCVVIF